MATGNFTHAGGRYTEAGYEAQTAIGKYNANQSDTLFEVGNGTSASSRANAFEVHSDGRATVGKNPTDNLDVATKGYVDTEFSALNLQNGAGDNSLKQKGSGSVVSTNAIAEGEGTICGSKVFRITGVILNQLGGSVILTLDSVTGLAVGDVVSLFLSNQYDDYASIVSVNPLSGSWSVEIDKELPETYARVQHQSTAGCGKAGGGNYCHRQRCSCRRRRDQSAE